MNSSDCTGLQISWCELNVKRTLLFHGLILDMLDIFLGNLYLTKNPESAPIILVQLVFEDQILIIPVTEEWFLKPGISLGLSGHCYEYKSLGSMPLKLIFCQFCWVQVFVIISSLQKFPRSLWHACTFGKLCEESPGAFLRMCFNTVTPSTCSS